MARNTANMFILYILLKRKVEITTLHMRIFAGQLNHHHMQSIRLTKVKYDANCLSTPYISRDSASELILCACNNH